MKDITLMATVIATSIGLCGLVNAQDSVEAITEKFDTEKAAALEEYLAKNPEAEDHAEGVQTLLFTYLQMGAVDKLPDLIEKAYAASDQSDPQMIFQQMVMPMIKACSETGQKDRARDFIKTVRADFANHQAAQQITQILDQMEGQLNLPGPGDTMDIAFTDTKGDEFDLAKLKGKVVLVDFWATWCGPCIAEMPNVIAAYEKHNSDGFEVVGISLDQSKADLEKFVEENKMPWTQYFDGKGWQNDIAGKFGINSIPATFLVGKDGKIVASNLRGAELEKAVKEELAK